MEIERVIMVAPQEHLEVMVARSYLLYEFEDSSLQGLMMDITKPTVSEGNYDTVLNTYGIRVVGKFSHLSVYVATEIEVLVFL